MALGDHERTFLIEGLDDWIGLWRFARSARDELPAATADEVREYGMAMVCNLVLPGYMRPGQLTNSAPGFREWEYRPDRSVILIDQRWRALGRDPNIPDICWFANTPSGDEVARQLWARRA